MVSIKREDVPTETGKKLYDLLVDSWNNPEFIRGTLAILRGDAKKQELIDAIEAGMTDSDDIISKSWEIAFGEKLPGD